MPNAAPRDAWPPADSHATTSSTDLATDFVGGRGALLWLALKTGAFSVLTLGFYRFWQKTRLRRWYWSSIRVGGLPLEYVGDPVEKLLGFLVAVVILAFYIGLVNLVLMFASFSLFQGNGFAYGLSLLGVLPLWFYASYRARRYLLARTRWRGLRFGLEPGAWGYAGRALGHWALTILTLGILWPRMTYHLEKYRTDRTSYGSARMVQGGRWQMLLPATKPLLAALLCALGVAGVAWGSGNIPLSLGLGLLAAMVGIYGIVHYRVTTLRLLTQTKTLDGVTLRLSASPFRILVIHLLGYCLAILAAALPALALGALILMLRTGNMLDDLGLAETLAPLSGLPRGVIFGASALLYFSIFLIWSALSHAFVTLPVMRHYSRGLTLHGSDHLADIQQRDRDEVPQAEGFAEALDVGSSI
ncbi:hypothetical protein P775_05275 [Puniceibacterium antarcticum]|uniref:DUF898 domain-containing protein n=1 Tax=Puniceibacterium antarcticum TaxID=1206336 RepID=A0A2G8RJF2_9RHOB|nr:DUF898 family protein [Puniceibacterium antarcticum]PIL21208.1 hypothetical protein P775_05275 [Puniceibacterium antarcticum]